jgi:hypothetical protein
MNRAPDSTTPDRLMRIWKAMSGDKKAQERTTIHEVEQFEYYENFDVFCEKAKGQTC